MLDKNLDWGNVCCRSKCGLHRFDYRPRGRWQLRLLLFALSDVRFDLLLMKLGSDKLIKP